MHRAVMLSLAFGFAAVLTSWEAPKAAVLRTLVSPNEEIDGCNDVIVGAYHEDGGFPDAGRAYVFNAQTGTVLQTITSPNAGADGHLGYSVSGAGDVNNDGYDDVVVGAPDEDVGMSSSAGRAYVISGQTGGLLRTLVSPNAEESGQFGWPVSGAGDANNDGHPDVVVGACFEDVGTSLVDAGQAYVFDGTTGNLLLELQSPNTQIGGYFGSSVSGAGDVNNGRYDDIIVGAYLEDALTADAGKAYIFSGQAGAELTTLLAFEGGGRFGNSVSWMGDIDGDGCDDVVVGAPNQDPGASP